MKNVHVIPTDKPSRLHLGNSGLVLCDLNYSSNTINSQNIYITSDEEIKEGDWYIYLGQINKRTRKNPKAEYSFPNYKKIILTTDPQLIAGGVQAIDDTFLEWFVKNPSCERVEVGYGFIRLTETDNKGYWISTPDTEFNMQIEELKQIKCYCGDATYCDCSPLEEPKQDYSGVHLRHCYQGEYEDGCKYGEDDCPAKPKEEPKQEKLEEAAEKEFPLIDTEWCRTGACEEENLHLLGHRRSFIKGAKWQQQNSYSEEEVISIVEKSRETGLTAEYLLLTEQFKKK